MSLNAVAEPSFELEENVIGSMILNKKCFDKSIDKGLQPEDFSKVSFQKCYKIMVSKQTQDILLLKDLMNNDKEWDDIRLATVHCITHTGFDHWLKLLFEKTADRKMINLAKKIPEIVSQDLTTEEKLDAVNQLLVDNKVTKNIGSPQKAEDILRNVETELKNTENIHRNLIRTGFQGIDKRINGFKKGDLIKIPQNSQLSNSWRKRDYQDGLIDWSLNSYELINFINAFDEPYIGASSYLNSGNHGKLYIKDCQLHGGDSSNHSFMSGIVSRHDKDWIVVSTSGKHMLLIQKVINKSGKNILDKIKVGDRFYSPSKELEISKKNRNIYNASGLKK